MLILIPVELYYTIIAYALSPESYYKVCIIDKNTKVCVDKLIQNGLNVFQTPRIVDFFANSARMSCKSRVKVGNITITKWIEMNNHAVYRIIFPDTSYVEWATNEDEYELDSCNYLSDIPNHEFMENIISWVAKFLPDYIDKFPINIKVCDCGKCRFSVMKESFYIPTPLIVSDLSIYLSPISQNKSYESLRGTVTHNGKLFDVEYDSTSGWYVKKGVIRHVVPGGNYQWLISKMALKII